MVTVAEMEHILQERGLLQSVTKGIGDRERTVAWLTCDSRSVVKDTLFICKGAAFHEEYLQQAADLGCIAYISEYPICTKQRLRGLIVNDIRKAMAAASAVFFEYRPGEPVLTGITGTKGKTTTAWYLKAMLDEWAKEKGEKESGLVSTVSNYDGMHREDAVMTTPEAPTLHEYLANAKKAGLHHVTMEVSSQALKYKRVRELWFQTGIFLNISEDHISPQEHVDFEDYFSAKLSMFRQTQTAVVNLDSEFSDRILKAARKAGSIVTFGQNRDADFRSSDICADRTGIRFRVTCRSFSEQFELAMKGKFNVENAVAAIAAASTYGVPVHCMKKALASTSVPGRMETFVSDDGRLCGIVDFAHNRLSFEKLFDAVFGEYSAYRKVITVFGCPGGKALNRRRELGIIAGLFSDHVFITSDDPGMECQADIAAQVREYVEMTGCGCTCIEERAEAVRQAVIMGEGNKEKTLILLLGRGSEKFQKIGSRACRYPTDSELIRLIFDEYAQRAFTSDKKCIMIKTLQSKETVQCLKSLSEKTEATAAMTKAGG